MKLNDKIINECYQELFKKSTPSTNFEQLKEAARISNNYDRSGRLVIPFLDYSIEKDVALDIIESISKKYKLSKKDKSTFSIIIHLGCSPKFKEE